MYLKGGYTNYGQDIGIMMLPTVFPRLVGDIGNARSFSMPVKYRIVRDIDMASVNEKNADEKLIQPFIQAAKSLEAEGCKAITTSCSFLGLFQRQLADSVNIPVFTSPLLLVPMLRNMLNSDLKIGIFTESKSMLSDDYFNQFDCSIDDTNICITGMASNSAFSQLIIGDNVDGNMKQIEDCIKNMTIQHMKKYPTTGAIILECINFSPFTSLIQKFSGVPVFGINQFLEYIDSCISMY